MNINRRQFMVGSSALLINTPLIAGELTGVQTATLSQEETLYAWMKLAGALDDRLVIWWLDGIRYGVVNSQAEPLYGMKVGIFQRYFRQPAGFWKLAMFELTYYTDLQTGKLLKQFQNPYTGETNSVRHVRLGPDIRYQTAEGQQPDPEDKVTQSMVRDYKSSLGPVVVHGDSVWIPSSVNARIVFPKPTAPQIVLSHYTTALGSLRDIKDDNVVSAPCTLSFENVLKWEPWMGMKDHPGSMMSKASGRKLEDPQQLPADYLQMAREVHPWLIRDPAQTLSAKVEQIQAVG